MMHWPRSQGDATAATCATTSLTSLRGVIVLAVLFSLWPCAAAAQGEAPLARDDEYIGASFRMGAVLPMVESYAESEPGVLLDLGLWFEIEDFALEPRAGIRFDVSPVGGSYFEIPFDLTFNYMPLDRDFTPIVGVGAGLHWLHESRYQEMVAGDVLRATSTWERSGGAWGFAAHARAGMLFFRTRRFRLALSVDFTMLFVELNGRSNPNSANLGLAFIL